MKYNQIGCGELELMFLFTQTSEFYLILFLVYINRYAISNNKNVQ